MIEVDTKWTVSSYAIHNEAMRAIEHDLYEEKIQHMSAIIALNDKRYAEGNELRAMALKIKETADANALELASEAQTYKEARNDAMREQNIKDNGIYATRDDLASVVKELKSMLTPLSDYITAQKGTIVGSQLTLGKLFASIAATGTIIGIVMALINMFVR